MTYAVKEAVMKRTFLLCFVTFGVFLGAAGAPSPIYEIFQRQWKFSPTTLTNVFAIYALSLLVALLVAGSLSDYLGRRPTLLGALAIEALSMAALATADRLAWLLVARALQGFATGLATSTVSASLIDAEPDRRLCHPILDRGRSNDFRTFSQPEEQQIDKYRYSNIVGRPLHERLRCTTRAKRCRNAGPSY